jgi:hypothetical protein
MPSPASGSPAQALLALRIIGASLGAGVTLFAGVSWLIHQQGGPFLDQDDAALANSLSIGFALVVALAAVAIWRARVRPLVREPPGTDWVERATTIQTPVIITWALLEAGALISVAVYFAYGVGFAALRGLALMWAGLAATWPQTSWFDPRP